MVKITTRALKIGVQSRFYPISTVGFCTFFPENFGQPYYIYEGRVVILGRIVSASGQIFRLDFRPQDEIFRPRMPFRPLDEQALTPKLSPSKLFKYVLNLFF